MDFHNIRHIHMGPREINKEDIDAEVQRVIELVRKQQAEKENRMLRCKMRVSEVVHTKEQDGKVGQERVSLTAVYGAEGTDNAKWSKWTPSANFNITISNPDAMNKLSTGHEYFVDFTPAL